MTDDLFASIRPRLHRTLAGFSAQVPEGTDFWHLKTSRPDRRDFPAPGLVLFLLRDVLRYPWAGPAEKVAWSVYCTFEGMPLAFENRKFGFTICHPKEKTFDVERVCGQLRAALKILETWLEPFAQSQVRAGNVTLGNRHGEFDARYRFFRQQADRAFETAATPPPPEIPKPGELPSLVHGLNHRFRAERDGFFYSTAMVDAFFSRLEHQLILLLAFRGTPLGHGELMTFLTAKWDEKLRALLDVDQHRAAQVVLGRMRRLKERIRNPFAHGGIENDGGSLHIHMPGIGALPANFSRFKGSIRFDFLPVKADDHSSACTLFDELDLLLSTGPLAGPNRLINAGVDPAFDAESLASYAAAIGGGEDTLEAFIDHWGDEWGRHANMNY